MPNDRYADEAAGIPYTEGDDLDELVDPDEIYYDDDTDWSEVDPEDWDE